MAPILKRHSVDIHLILPSMFKCTSLSRCNHTTAVHTECRLRNSWMLRGTFGFAQPYNLPSLTTIILIPRNTYSHPEKTPSLPFHYQRI